MKTLMSIVALTLWATTTAFAVETAPCRNDDRIANIVSGRIQISANALDSGSLSADRKEFFLRASKSSFSAQENHFALKRSATISLGCETAAIASETVYEIEHSNDSGFAPAYSTLNFFTATSDQEPSCWGELQLDLAGLDFNRFDERDRAAHYTVGSLRHNLGSALSVLELNCVKR